MQSSVVRSQAVRFARWGALSLALLLALTLLAERAATGDDNKREPIIVVVSAKSPLTNVSMSELRRLFQSEVVTRGRTQLIPLNLSRSHRLRTSFDRRVMGMSPRQVTRFWSDRRIRGGAGAPKVAPNATRALITAARYPKVVVYSRLRRLPNIVKIITVDGKRHTDPDYPLTY